MRYSHLLTNKKLEQMQSILMCSEVVNKTKNQLLKLKGQNDEKVENLYYSLSAFIFA
jgi:hypothetical protein